MWCIMYQPPGSLWRAVHEITPTLYLCSGTAVANKQVILDKNIKCIVNATIDLPNRSWNEEIVVVRGTFKS